MNSGRIFEWPLDKDIKEAFIPYGLIRIGGCAFKGCSSLTNVTIPNSFTKIEDYTYVQCAFIVIFMASNSVTNNYRSIFSNYSKITDISILGDINEISRKCIFSIFITNITIPNSVIEIGNSAFYMCF